MLIHRPGRIAAGVGIAVVLAVTAGFLTFRDGSEKPDATLNVVSVPDDLTLTLDGTTIEPNGQTLVTGGEHRLEARRSGFETQTRTFSVKSKGRVDVSFRLAANSPEGKQWYRRHPDKAAQGDGEWSRGFDEDSKRRLAKYPIIARLPLVGPEFRIDYGRSRRNPKDSLAVGIYIRWGSPAGRGAALSWMRANGFPPEKHEIIYLQLTAGKWTYP